MSKHRAVVPQLVRKDITKDGKEVPIYRLKTYARPQQAIDVIEGRATIRKIKI